MILASWHLVADACAARKKDPTWGAFISSYRIHWKSRGDPPLFEGAQMCQRTGINRAELLAIAYGLHALVLGMESDEYAAVPVEVWTDSQIAFNLSTGTWQARSLGAITKEVIELCQRIEALVGGPVWFHKASEKDVKAADTLGRNFKNVCDHRHRASWSS